MQVPRDALVGLAVHQQREHVALARRLIPALGARAAWLGIGLYALATPADAYAHLLYGHQLTACLLTVGALWLVEGIRADRHVRAAWGGLLCSAAIGVEYSAAFAGLPIAVFVLLWARRGRVGPALAASVGAAVPIALLGWYHAAVYGGPLRTGYHNVINPEFAAKHGEGFLGLVAPSWTGLHTHVLASEAGLLWWAPLSLAALAGLWDMSRAPGDSPLRSHARVQLGVFVALLLNAGLALDVGGRHDVVRAVGKLRNLEFFVATLLPQAIALGKTVQSGDESCLDPSLF